MPSTVLESVGSPSGAGALVSLFGQQGLGSESCAVTGFSWQPLQPACAFPDAPCQSLCRTPALCGSFLRAAKTGGSEGSDWHWRKGGVTAPCESSTNGSWKRWVPSVDISCIMPQIDGLKIQSTCHQNVSRPPVMHSLGSPSLLPGLSAFSLHSCFTGISSSQTSWLMKICSGFVFQGSWPYKLLLFEKTLEK